MKRKRARKAHARCPTVGRPLEDLATRLAGVAEKRRSRREFKAFLAGLEVGSCLPARALARALLIRLAGRIFFHRAVQ